MSTSSENKIVIQKLVDEIQLAYKENEAECSSSVIKRMLKLLNSLIRYILIFFCILVEAMKRKYESERRLFNESQKGNDIKSDRLKKAKYEQRKQRVCKFILIKLMNFTIATSHL